VTSILIADEQRDVLKALRILLKRAVDQYVSK